MHQSTVIFLLLGSLLILMPFNNLNLFSNTMAITGETIKLNQAFPSGPPTIPGPPSLPSPANPPGIFDFNSIYIKENDFGPFDNTGGSVSGAGVTVSCDEGDILLSGGYSIDDT
jgi:hypothetical protein